MILYGLICSAFITIINALSNPYCEIPDTDTIGSLDLSSWSCQNIGNNCGTCNCITDSPARGDICPGGGYCAYAYGQVVTLERAINIQDYEGVVAKVTFEINNYCHADDCIEWSYSCDDGTTWTQIAHFGSADIARGEAITARTALPFKSTCNDYKTVKFQMKWDAQDFGFNNVCVEDIQMHFVI